MLPLNRLFKERGSPCWFQKGGVECLLLSHTSLMQYILKGGRGTPKPCSRFGNSMSHTCHHRCRISGHRLSGQSQTSWVTWSRSLTWQTRGPKMLGSLPDVTELVIANAEVRYSGCPDPKAQVLSLLVLLLPKCASTWHGSHRW